MSLDLTLKDSEFNFKMDKPNDHKVYEFEDFRLDTLHLMLYHENAEISLAPKAVETLLALVEKRGQIRDQIRFGTTIGRMVNFGKAITSRNGDAREHDAFLSQHGAHGLADA